MSSVRSWFVMGMTLALLIAAAGEGLAQRDDRAVRVQGRQSTGNEQRVALVIGNSAYKAISPLKNPVNDAEDMATALRRSGFKVTLLQNANRKQMNRAIRDLGNLLQKGGVGLFYYAGHGVQVGGVNYLVPLGAEINQQFEVEDEAVSANRVMGMMEAAGNRLNMVFLDACRNNPYKGSFRSTSQGLAAVRNAPKGSLISYATGAGAVAEDGAGRNGTYTKNLLRYIHTPGLELTTMMKRVRTGVRLDTRGRQIPYELSSLEGDFYFTKANLGSTALPGPVTANPTKGPSDVSINLDDITGAAKKQKAARAAWAVNLSKMKATHAKIQAIDQDNITPNLKVIAWQRFLFAFQENNPFTPEDDDLRGQAQSRIAYWQGEQRRVARLEKDRLRQAAKRRRRAEEERRRTAIRRDSRGSTWRDPVTGMEFVLVPGGSFQMGCHLGNGGQCDNDERPIRTVRLNEFWMGKHEVTQGQWKRIMGNNPSDFKKGDNYPVEQASWNHIQEFIRRLNQKSAIKVRLPSEAQWEYACREGGKTIKFGTANGRVSSGNANYQKNERGPNPVGRYQANSLGLHDMSGNVWEWVQDKKTSYRNVGTDNPIYERSGNFRVIRGGSWNVKSRALRCSNRGNYAPSGKENFLGFRLVRLR